MLRQITFIILVILTLFPFLANSQQFEVINAGIVGVGRSSVSWADYDKDGDLDILVTGNTGSGPYVAAIYRNDLGSFININAGLTGIDNSSVAWGDYDNDGDPDILTTGRSTGSIKTWLYNNDNGVFTSVNTVFPEIGSYGSVTWGDIDGDADLDALISGNYESKLYRNENNAFTEIPVPLPAVSNCWTNIGDYDNDGDQDVFIMGDVGGWPVSAICKNEDGFFFEMDSTGIMPLSGGSASWYDYDKDLDLDVLVTGFDQYLEPKTYIFRNDGDMVFTNIWPGLAGAALGTAAWGDYDNDGDADILLTGQNAACGSLSSLVYRNDGNDNFTDINAPLDGAERGSADWGDYDNDGDLDIIVSGFNGSGLASTKLYRNTNGSNSFTMSGAPVAPADLHSVASNHSVQLSWNKSLDNNTPENGITYNLRVGTYSGGQNVLSASVDATGFLLLPQSGNMGNDTTWLLHLPDGDYFWSVQALDHSFGFSNYAEEQQFSVMNVGVPETIENEGFNVFPNPFQNVLEISTTVISRISICNSVGITIFESENKSVNKINTTVWPSGIYYLTVTDGKQKSSSMILKK